MKKNTHKRPYSTNFEDLILFFLSLFYFGLDQASKFVAFELFVKNKFFEKITLIENFAYLQYHENYGLAFGIPLAMPLIIFATLILLVVLYRFFEKEFFFQVYPFKYGIMLLYVGALSNLLDRIKSGFVIDYFVVGQWPAFNLADVYICVGVLLLVLFYGRIEKNSYYSQS